MSSSGVHALFNGTVSLKSILSRRKSSWLFRKKKSVRFTAEDEPKERSRTQLDIKWRKYVAQQFRTLRKHKRSRWLGRGGRNRRRPNDSSGNHSMSTDAGERAAGTSDANGLEDSSTSFDLPPPFEIPQPDHKKRKKKDLSRKNTKQAPRKRNTARSSSKRGTNTKKSRTPSNQGSGRSGSEEQEAPHIKRPPNAFLLFSRACRLQFKSLMVPDFDSKVVNMVLGHIWRYLSKDERQTFYKEFEEQRQLYYEEKKRLFPDAEHDPEEQKRPLNAFMMFCQDQRAALYHKTSMYNGDRLVKIIARRWRRMKPSEKRVYMERARQAKISFDQNQKESETQNYVLPTKESCKGDGSQNKAPGHSTASLILKRMGKNNNKWFTDSSESDGSRPSSTTEVKPINESTITTSPLVRAPAPSSSPPPSGKQAAEDSPKHSTSDSDSESEVKEVAERATVKTHISPSSSDTSCMDKDHEERLARKRRRRRRRLKQLQRRKKQVHWKDELYPWDVFDPVSAVLGDEDICLRLCGAGTSRDDTMQRSLCTRCCLQPRGYPCLSCQGLTPPRQCQSCLSLGSLKHKVETAFRKPEQDLANCSSSASSVCDLCPYAILPQVISSSSEDSSVSYRLSNFHISSHEPSDRCSTQPRTSCSRQCQESHCVVASSYSDVSANQPLLPCWLRPATPSSSRPEMDNPSTSACHVPHLPFCPLQRHSPMIDQLNLLSSDKLINSSGQQDSVDNDTDLHDRKYAVSQQHPKLRNPDSLYQKSNCPPDSTNMNMAWTKCNTDSGSSPAEKQQQIKDEKRSDGSSGISGIVHRMEAVTLSPRNEIASSLPMGDGERDNAVRNSDKCISPFEPEDCHQEIYKPSNKHAPNARAACNVKDTYQEGKKSDPTVICEEKKGIPCSKTGCDTELVDVVPRTGNVSPFENVQPVPMPSEYCVSPLLGDDFIQNSILDPVLYDQQSLLERHVSLSVSDNRQSMSSKASRITDAVSKRQLKRRHSYDSAEAVNSSNNFTVSNDSLCSLPKYAFVTDKSHKGKSQKCFKTCSRTNLATSCSLSGTVTLQMLLDLELEYCERQQWIQ